MGGVVVFGGFILAILVAAISRNKESNLTPEKSKEPSIEDDIKAVMDEKDAGGLKITAVPSYLASLGITLDKWIAYVKSQGGASLGTKNKANHLGMFLMGPRVLNELGYMYAPKNVNGVWQAEWREPYSEAEYLSNPAMQYDSFIRMTERDAKQVKARYKDAVDLSGALAVIKRYGLGTMDKWLKDPANRQESTTSVYRQYSGML